MSKVLRVSDSNYKVIVSKGGTITFDTTNSGQDSTYGATSLLAGERYVISIPGTTDFTLIGAPNNQVGTAFQATGPGTGTGVAVLQYPAGDGSVIIKGNLIVEGETTTIESTVSTISDNIVLLSEGNINAGLPSTLDRPYSSGLEIERGTLSNTRWVYDDSLTWTLGPGVNGTGTWLAETGPIGTAQRLPLATPGIIAGGSLYVSVGAGVITVAGSSDYEEKVFRYVNGTITPDPVTRNVIVDDDAIPNAKSIRDYLNYGLSTAEFTRLIKDNSYVEIVDKNNTISTILEVGNRTTIQTLGTHGFLAGDTITIQGVDAGGDAFIEGLNGTYTVTDVPTTSSLEINYTSTGGDKAAYVQNSASTVDEDSKISLVIEDTEIAKFYNNRIELGSIQILDSEISTTVSNEDLLLSAPGTGTVTVKDVFAITETPSDDDGDITPPAPIEGVKIYSKESGPAGTGIYFVNKDNVNDELISNNRALLYSMLF